jgi:Ala-tRNA(Pro) deacylase
MIPASDRREEAMKAKLVTVLEEAGIPYEPLRHEHTESAAAEAKVLGLSPDEVAKTLIATTPIGYVRAVVAASERIDMHKLREVLGVPGKQLRLATEEELARDYVEFDLGAVPPFGGSRDEPVVLDIRLMERESIVLEAGSHEESVRVKTDDLRKLTHARVADIAQG